MGERRHWLQSDKMGHLTTSLLTSPNYEHKQHQSKVLTSQHNITHYHEDVAMPWSDAVQQELCTQTLQNISHYSAAALFFSWLRVYLLEPVRLRWVVSKFRSIKPILNNNGNSVRQ